MLLYVLLGVELSLSKVHAVATMYDAVQQMTDAEGADASEVDEEAASGSDEEEVSSKSGASEFEDKGDKAKHRAGRPPNSMCSRIHIFTFKLML